MRTTIAHAFHEMPEGLYPIQFVPSNAPGTPGERRIHVLGTSPCACIKRDVLADDCYSDWAKDKRMSVEGQLRQAVHALRRLYLARTSEAGDEQIFLHLEHI